MPTASNPAHQRPIGAPSPPSDSLRVRRGKNFCSSFKTLLSKVVGSVRAPNRARQKDRPLKYACRDFARLWDFGPIDRSGPRTTVYARVLRRRLTFEKIVPPG